MGHCVNLRDLFGKKYRISFDSARRPGEKADPWFMQIRCRRGTVYPYGGSRLAVELDYHRKVSTQVAQIPGVIQTQDGDEEKTFVFDVALFDQVAAIVMPYKRPVLSAEQIESKTRKIKLARANRH